MRTNLNSTRSQGEIGMGVGVSCHRLGLAEACENLAKEAGAPRRYLSIPAWLHGNWEQRRTYSNLNIVSRAAPQRLGSSLSFQTTRYSHTAVCATEPGTSKRLVRSEDLRAINHQSGKVRVEKQDARAQRHTHTRTYTQLLNHAPSIEPGLR